MSIIKEWRCFARQKTRTKIEELRDLRIEGFPRTKGAEDMAQKLKTKKLFTVPATRIVGQGYTQITA
jgi:hypothetical protein